MKNSQLVLIKPTASLTRIVLIAASIHIKCKDIAFSMVKKFSLLVDKNNLKSFSLNLLLSESSQHLREERLKK